MRAPVSWPPAFWYQDRKSHDDQPDDQKKCKEDDRQQPQPNEDQTGVINFYIGDHYPTKACADERITADGKRCEEVRRRRLKIIRKHLNPLEQEHIILVKSTPTSQKLVHTAESPTKKRKPNSSIRQSTFPKPQTTSGTSAAPKSSKSLQMAYVCTAVCTLPETQTG